jgi:hypothetical protein
MTAAGFRSGALALAVGFLGACLASPASAETLSFKADLLAVAGTDSKASGTLTADYDTSSKKLTWKGSYGGLGSYATAANLHGATDRIVVRLRNIDSPFEGSAIVSERQATDLIAGRWYILVRTAAHPQGELRGQITRAN